MRRSGRASLATYLRALCEARGYRWPIAGVLALSLFSAPLALLKPLPLKIAVDSVLGDEPVPGFLHALAPGGGAPGDGVLVLVVVLALAVAVVTQVRALASGVLRTWTGQRLVLDVRARLFHHAQQLSLSYHDTRGTSDSTYRIQYDASSVKSIAMDGFIPFISSTFTLVAMVYVTARIDLALAAVALVVAPALFLALRANVARLRGGWHGVKQLDSSNMSVVQEVLGSIRVVKAFGQEDRERQRYVDQASEKVRARTRLAVLESGLSLVVALVVAAGTAAVLFIGVRNVQAGTLTLGNLLLVMSYVSQLYAPLEKMSERIGEVQSALVGAERAFSLLDQAPDVAERAGARSLGRARGQVSFEDVSFSYDGNLPVLHGISFEAPPGARVGIAGTTGAGKTTLVSLLTRFYDPSEGRITLDGADLRDYRLADLRDQFAIVLQDPVLFSTSIAENISYARPGARPQDVVAAARAAHAHEFVAALSDGYDTLVGERGMRLSGGERQRISLARAFLKDAPVLILDEPTSSVDTVTEALIMDAMHELMQGRTTFLIAHRLSTLEHCHIRLVIDHGRLVEQVPT